MRIRGKYRNEKDKGLQNDKKQVGPHQKSSKMMILGNISLMKKLCMRK